MSKNMNIKIMVLVGSNGKASACVEGDLGWGDLADNIANWERNEMKDPDATARYFVNLELPIPAIENLHPTVEEA